MRHGPEHPPEHSSDRPSHRLPPIQPSHLPPHQPHQTPYSFHPTHSYPHHNRYALPQNTSSSHETPSSLYTHPHAVGLHPPSYFSYPPPLPHPTFISPTTTHGTSVFPTQDTAYREPHRGHDSSSHGHTPQQSRYYPHMSLSGTPHAHHPPTDILPTSATSSQTQPPQTNSSVLRLPSLTRTPPYYSNPLPYLPPGPPGNPQQLHSVIPDMPPTLPPVAYMPTPTPSHITPQPPTHIPPPGFVYNAPYHQSFQTPTSSLPAYQQPHLENMEWAPHVVSNTYTGYPHASGDPSDTTNEFPPYYLGPDGVPRYVGHVAPRKRRLQWTPELHAKFVAAVGKLGIETAVPKLLLQEMNVPGLTRENVASHLQKYRESERKKKLEAERATKPSQGRSALGEDSEKEYVEQMQKSEEFEPKKRMLETESDEIEGMDTKRQKTETKSQVDDSERERELTEQEVESFASVRARVDETLQLQPARSRLRRDDSDVK